MFIFQVKYFRVCKCAAFIVFRWHWWVFSYKRRSGGNPAGWVWHTFSPDTLSAWEKSPDRTDREPDDIREVTAADSLRRRSVDEKIKHQSHHTLLYLLSSNRPFNSLKSPASPPEILLCCSSGFSHSVRDFQAVPGYISLFPCPTRDGIFLVTSIILQFLKENTALFESINVRIPDKWASCIFLEDQLGNHPSCQSKQHLFHSVHKPLQHKDEIQTSIIMY